MNGVATLPPLSVVDRADGVRAESDRVGTEGFVVTDLGNIRYLTGFTGSNAVLVVRPDDLVLVTDGRYRDQAADQTASVGVTVEVVVSRDATPEVARLVHGMRRVAVEADHITWEQQRSWADALAPELVPTAGVVLHLRAVKDEGEIARLERACAIADDALADVRPMLLEGPTERRFARALEAAMLDRGAEGPSFETIIASGPNSARPHARPTDRVIGSSGDPEFVVIDFGALYDGYHSDMTRTLIVGEPTQTQQEIFDTVAAAQAAGVAAVRAGVAGSSVDAACRDHITAAGYGEEFLHGTGHGIGLVIHELPRVHAHSSDLLAPGHCVTVEPGVYVTGHGGVRIEDSVVVTATGCRRITGSPYAPEP